MNLNVFKAVQNKIAKDALNNLKAWLDELDLDDDGKKDIKEELLPALQNLFDGMNAGILSIDIVKLHQAVEAGKRLAKAAEELAAISKEVLDTEKAQAAAEQAKHAINTAAKFISDVIAKHAAEAAKG